MKKPNKPTLMIIGLLMSCLSYSQAEFTPQHNLSLGYGIGNFSNSILKLYKSKDSYTYDSQGPFFGKYEYQLKEKIGIGINVSYITAEASFKTQDTSGTSIKTYTNYIYRTGINIMGRANFHFLDDKNWDPYFGISFGFRKNNWKIDFTDERLGELDLNVSRFINLFPLGIEATLGTRYMFTNKIGAYVEIGVARAFLQFGITGTL